MIRSFLLCALVLLTLASSTVFLTGCGGSGGSGDQTLSASYRKAMTLGDPAARVTQLLIVAGKQQKAGDMSGMEQSLFSASEAAESIETPVGRAASLNRVATALARMDRLGEAKKLLKEVSRASEQIETPAARLPELTRMAYIHAKYLDNRNAAEVYFQQCEELLEQIDPNRPEACAESMLLLSQTYHGLKMSDDAERMIQASVEAAAQLQDPRKRADATVDAASILNKMKQDDQSQATFQQAGKFATAIEDPLSRGFAYVHLAEKLRAAGMGDDARKALEQAEALVNQVDGSLRGSLMEAIQGARR